MRPKWLQASKRAGVRAISITVITTDKYYYSLTLFQEKAKELRLKEFMEHQLENKDQQLEKLAVRQQEVSCDFKRAAVIVKCLIIRNNKCTKAAVHVCTHTGQFV